MSVTTDQIHNMTFTVGQYSSGQVTDESTNPIAYKETSAHPYAQYGTGTITLDAATTTNGQTTITGTIVTTFGDVQLSGRLVGNDSNDILVYVTFQGQSSYFLLTNGPAASTNVTPAATTPAATGQQPGVGNTAYVANESAGIAYQGNSSAPCFATGTLIRTTRGQVAVEDLVSGDTAITASGATRTIVWIGHRDVACGVGSREPRPVRVQAGAFGAGAPFRDLLLSPGHPVLVGADADAEGGHLVPIMCLINGTTVARMPVDAVTYWHVELDVHDILDAEGLWAESYLDWGDRAFFSDEADHRLADPDLVVPGLAGRCRPVAIDGPVVEAERRRLDMVFASQLVDACAWPTCEEILAAG